MHRGELAVLYRCAAVALAIALLWLAQWSGRAGIAGIYGTSAAAYFEEVQKVRDPDKRGQFLALAEQNVTRALRQAPDHAGYVIQAVDIAAAGGEDRSLATDPDRIDSISLMQAALLGTPASADLWSRLASARYEQDGASITTQHSLDRALYLGPREYGPLMVNANIVFNSAAELDVESRLRGWNNVVCAAAVPALTAPIMQLAEDTGQLRQLRRLIREKEKQHEAGRENGRDCAPRSLVE